VSSPARGGLVPGSVRQACQCMSACNRQRHRAGAGRAPLAARTSTVHVIAVSRALPSARRTQRLSAAEDGWTVVSMADTLFTVPGGATCASAESECKLGSLNLVGRNRMVCHQSNQ